MIPLVQLPVLLEEYAPSFKDLFSAGEYGQLMRYLSGLLLSENKTIEGMNRLFVQQAQHPSTLNRFLTAGGYDIQQVNERRIAWMQECAHTRFKGGHLSQRGVLIVDDTLLAHVGQHFEHIAKLYDHVHDRYVWAHNLVTLHYSDEEVDYPLYFQLWKPAQLAALEQALLDSKIRIRDKERALKETAPEKWRRYLLRLANQHQEQELVRAAYRNKLTIAQELVRAFHQTYAEQFLPLVFDSWYSAPWFCRWLDREMDRAYVATLTPDEEVFQHANQFCRLDSFAGQLKEQHLARPANRLFQPVSISYKGKEETYFTYTHVHSIRNFGHHRLVINYRLEDLSDNPSFFICNRTKWNAGTITRIRRHRWPIEVYHEEGKAEGLDQYQIRDFEAIQKHIAFIALIYSMLQRARFDASLGAKLQQALDQTIQGSLAFWRRVFQAHALTALLQWVVQAVLVGQEYLPLCKKMAQMIAYPS